MDFPFVNMVARKERSPSGGALSIAIPLVFPVITYPAFCAGWRGLFQITQRPSIRPKCRVEKKSPALTERGFALQHVKDG
jgi:hypothetical protein